MILEMRDICKDYPMGKSVNHILKHIDLDVEAGEYLAIMGPSGSGKTTLMNLIGCLDVPTAAATCWAGRTSPNAPPSSWRRCGTSSWVSCSSPSTCCPS